MLIFWYAAGLMKHRFFTIIETTWKALSASVHGMMIAVQSFENARLNKECSAFGCRPRNLSTGGSILKEFFQWLQATPRWPRHHLPNR